MVQIHRSNAMTHARPEKSLLLLLVGLLVVLAPAYGDWPNFRGPNHDGISDEQGLRTTWTEPLPLVWESNIGSAFSSFACVGDRVYTCGTQEKEQVIYCLNADTGNVLWQKRIEEEYRESSGGNGTRATPAVDDGRVYILGARGTLLCLDADSGSKVFKRVLRNVPKWGYSGSVLIEGDLAIVASGEDDGALVALDNRTGETVWRCGEDNTGYATPYPFTFEGARYIVGFTASAAIIAEARSGRLVWRTPWKTAWNVNAASPIYHDGHLFIGSGYRTGCALFRLRKEGDGLTADEVWKSRVLRPKFQTPILHDGKLYASDQRALVCVDFMTGERLWHKLRVKHGTLAFTEGHLLLLTESGQLQIARASPEGFEPVTTADIMSGRCWTVSVLHRGMLYARNLSRIVCFDLR
jgi:outer membrane protein assembly factor BamB